MPLTSDKGIYTTILRPQKEDLWKMGKSPIDTSYYLLTAVFLSKPPPLYIKQPEALVGSGI
jgi:hypothetical protein